MKPWQPDPATFSEQERLELAAWLVSRPPIVRAAWESHPPGLYWNKVVPGQIMFLVGYTTNVPTNDVISATVHVTLEYNTMLAMEREVRGVPLAELEAIPDEPSVVRARIDAQRGMDAAKARTLMTVFGLDEIGAIIDKPCTNPSCTLHGHEHATQKRGQA